LCASAVQGCCTRSIIWNKAGVGKMTRS
jgi:hypothetical protein